MKIVVADLGSGNLRSVEKALAAVGADVQVSADPDAIARADRLVVPGQGAFGACAVALNQGGGAMRQALKAFIATQRPYFGICIGMQLLFEASEENPGAQGLGVLPGQVRRFAGHPGLKVPHMGWNQTRRGPAAADGVPDGAFFYFVHSYYPDPARPEDVALTSEHGAPFCAAVARGPLFATQFHPEKSQAAGLALLRRFAVA
ncbi:MAG TPA: imidazole glycerol phosphate synthase subunit HisH [Polyangia bacterium]|nr:imidazole glycerol phosphate synthase subunit HisH [Polyangia bacterium]